MPGLPVILVQLLFLVAFMSMLISQYKWTALVRLEYDRYRAAWLDDGCPRSHWWRPPQGSWVGTNICSIRWLFQTPSWVRNDPEAGEHLRKYRIYFVVSIVLLLVVFTIWGSR